jgi:hypothetical protein
MHVCVRHIYLSLFLRLDVGFFYVIYMQVVCHSPYMRHIFLYSCKCELCIWLARTTNVRRFFFLVNTCAKVRIRYIYEYIIKSLLVIAHHYLWDQWTEINKDTCTSSKINFLRGSTRLKGFSRYVKTVLASSLITHIYVFLNLTCVYILINDYIWIYNWYLRRR